MQRPTLLLFLLVFIISCNNPKPTASVIVHGGAGYVTTDDMTEQQEKEIRAVIEKSLQKSNEHLANGGTSVEAVQIAINILEDSTHFNAGKGSVFTSAGTHELDASIMNGKNVQAGAVAGLTNIKNPIDAAIAVMEHSPHVFLIGKGAEEFALAHGIETVPQSYFYNEDRYIEHIEDLDENNKKFGTVGAVAIDKNGNIAAGTSTGGMTTKRYGRVGDVPVIGAGTYAENGVGGLSATGHGEYFIRNVATYDIAAQVKYGTSTLDEAGYHTLMKKLKSQGGDGGVIGIDKYGKVVIHFNTVAMPRGYINSEGETVVMIDQE
ncbi:MAG: isoaspartyl peptidase/L-asparaginase [Flavobacteriales bacterium]|nr:isoaspartyl peptidase/L-asparaginase [Flavobacteriales bacterium]